MMYEDQHDQAIEDVLHALRTTEPPQGYEARIHNALLQAQQESHHVHFNTLTSHTSHRNAAKAKELLAYLLPYMSWATACAVALIVGTAVRSHLQSTSTQQNSSVQVTQRNGISTLPHAVPKAKTEVAAPTKHAPSPHAKKAQNSEESTPPQRIEVAIQTHEYIPEPSLPLTNQERLVIRMMRHNTAQQLSEYTPDARARQLHEDAQAYHDYFAPTSLDGQPIYVQPIEHPQISGAN